MALLSIQNVSLTLSGPELLSGVSLQIEEGQRVCLLGRNGAGKSTFMKLMFGDIKPDSGVVARQQGLKVAMLSQEVPEDITGNVYSVVASGIGQLGEALAAYHDASVLLDTGNDADAALAAMSKAQHVLDEKGGWELHQKIQTVINHLKLNADAEFSSLSGGVKRRTMLARALASEPDLLLLDEPTNHLDVESITWLEEFLLRYVKSLVLITHDRMFLRKVANRIVELDRGHLADWSCDYDTFLERKEEVLHAEEEEWRRMDQKLKEEEIWIRKGIKARRTRNMGRVRALQDLRKERAKRRERSGNVGMAVQTAERSGKVVVKAEHVTYTYPDASEPVIKDFSTVVSRGDKVALIGPNGVGKTTLLRLLLGELTPQVGNVQDGTKLEVAYFDQLRNVLDENKSVRDNVADGNDTVEIAGVRKHVVGYLKDFLFDPERMNMTVNTLSGGERNRLLLAKLFTQPCNVLVLDEPTNDLDVETLELLEAQLVEFAGTVLIVSHDRAFVNNVVTSTLAFEGNGVINEYVGGYDDWIRQRPDLEVEKAANKKAAQEKAEPKKESAKPKKLSYNEQRELDMLRNELEEIPAKLESMEEEQAALETKLADPQLYANSPEEFEKTTARLEALAEELESVMMRWEEAEARAEELSQFEK
ncbi:ATP-binding cassette domain-containing protein [Halodesulfovibrio marinisediminis]|uniref:ATP-binding protein Uup n=1 Tax=Halodesulfovibrio marinisediminis DSM 17456 TaxID=1121457 RepID=A0A1N6IEW5_9BACT|nr:ATP-binding cassette domain-containing protein [Halodesulfovibrio marinisediminis]SIO30574.1 ATP-binding cassette, subfamily F, uup [Halodesulfovibrio marinisediminis DSM 17456]